MGNLIGTWFNQAQHKIINRIVNFRGKKISKSDENYVPRLKKTKNLKILGIPSHFLARLAAIIDPEPEPGLFFKLEPELDFFLKAGARVSYFSSWNWSWSRIYFFQAEARAGFFQAGARDCFFKGLSRSLVFSRKDTYIEMIFRIDFVQGCFS